jgi:hypothetical protein
MTKNLELIKEADAFRQSGKWKKSLPLLVDARATVEHFIKLLEDDQTSRLISEANANAILGNDEEAVNLFKKSFDFGNQGSPKQGEALAMHYPSTWQDRAGSLQDGP